MRALLITFVLTALVGTAVADDPTRALVTRYCTKCHNGDEAFDLRKLPADRDSDAWAKMLSAVEAAQMPPPKEHGTIEERFPMDPAERAALVDALTVHLAAQIRANARPVHMTYDVWSDIARQLALVVLPKADVDAVLTPWPYGTSPDVLPPGYLVGLQQRSLEVCRAIAVADAAHPPKERKLLPNGAAGGWERVGASRLLAQLFGEPPNGRLLTEATSFERTVHAQTHDWTETWVAMCTTYLSGPRLMYLYADLPGKP